MSTSDHPETDGQTERVNPVLDEILRGYVQSFTNWSELLPMMEFAINNSVHASTTHTTFFVNGLRHPCLPTHLECDSSSRKGGARSSKNRSSSCSSRVEVIDDVSSLFCCSSSLIVCFWSTVYPSSISYEILRKFSTGPRPVTSRLTISFPNWSKRPSLVSVANNFST